jgi:hypothetical protein
MNNKINPDYGAAGEARLRAFVEQVVGGKVTHMQRQIRWRPAWFVDVERNGTITHLHLRGEREGDVAIFPDLQREADVISVLGEHGIAVPRIYGVCTEPPAILMEALPGSRNVAEAASDEERRSICRQFIANVVAMHKLPVAPFVAKGLALPAGAENIVLAGLHAYMPLYERTKRKPEPFIDYILGWLKRNVPKDRTRASFIQFDSGQFLFKDGKVTGLYDFEFSLIGDPMNDLATMRMRETVEPLGDDMRNVCKYYEELSGEPIDHSVINFHTLLFAIISVMQFAGTVSVPDPGDPHSVYLEWDLALRQVVLRAMEALTGWSIEPPAPLVERTGDNAALIAKLAETVGRISTSTALDAATKDSAAQLIEWVGLADAQGAQIMARDLADVSAVIGREFTEWAEAQVALEAFVIGAGADQDERLFRLFSSIEARRMLVYGPTRIGKSAQDVHLAPTR